jgi:hypothetical protein
MIRINVLFSLYVLSRSSELITNSLREKMYSDFADNATMGSVGLFEEYISVDK